MGDMMMMMYFHGGFNEVILFDFWRISTLGGLIGSMIGCFIMGVLYEGIKSYREHWMNGAFHAVNYNQVFISNEVDNSISQINYISENLKIILYFSNFQKRNFSDF